MAWLTQNNQTFSGSTLGSSLNDLLTCGDIEPGSQPGYQLTKILYEQHPLGKKIVDAPITMAQSQQREVVVPGGPEERLREAFLAARKEMRADEKNAAHARLARIYGLSVVAIVQEGVDPATPLDPKTLATRPFSVNVLDPLNTAGSVNVLNQDPNAATFQDVPQVVVAGKPYHRSRTLVLMNESPIYISYTPSSFGYFGRSVFQRALYPLKSFVQTMRTDDLVTRKAGVIVAMIKQVGSMVDRVMANVVASKRALAKEAFIDDVLSIGDQDKIESLNLQNLEGPYALARKNIIDNLAAACDMPSIILNSETYAEGFGEGTEDAKKVATFVDNFRIWMGPSYDFLDVLAMHKAWTPDLFAAIREEFPQEYGGVDFDAAFYMWRNSFEAKWPSLITEPPSDKANVAKVRYEAAVGLAEVMLPKLGPVNQVAMLTWLADITREEGDLFRVPLELDPDELEEYAEKQAEAAEQLRLAGGGGEPGGDDEVPEPPRPFADSVAPLRLADKRRA